MEPSHLRGLELIKDLTWNDVFAFWRENEGSNPDWIALAKERGHASWEEWRMTYVKQARLDERAWKLYRVIDPAVSVPNFLGGPFRAWIERFYGDAGPTPRFAEVAERLKHIENTRVLSLLDAFPEKTTVCGIAREDSIMIFEGTHRCSALAMAVASGHPITTELQIALGSALPNDATMIAAIVEGYRKNAPPARG